jgi:hypothetical protein
MPQDKPRSYRPSTEHEFDSLPFFIHGAIEILTGLPDFDVGLIHPVRSATHLQMLTDALVNLRRVSLDPPEDGQVIHIEPALTHHLFDVAVR